MSPGAHSIFTLLKFSFGFVIKHPKLIFIRIIGFLPYFLLGIFVALSITKSITFFGSNIFQAIVVFSGAYVLSGFMKVCCVIIENGEKPYDMFFSQANYFFPRVLIVSAFVKALLLLVQQSHVKYLQFIFGGLMYPLAILFVSVIVANDYGMRKAIATFAELLMGKFSDIIKVVLMYYAGGFLIPGFLLISPLVITKLILIVPDVNFSVLLLNKFAPIVSVISKLSPPVALLITPFCLTSAEVFVLKAYLELSGTENRLGNGNRMNIG